MAPKRLAPPASGLFYRCRLLHSSKVTCCVFLYVFASCWTAVKPCGEDPMTNIKNIAQSKGVSPDSILRYLQTYSPARYLELVQMYSRYQECMGHIDTGYFKRGAPDFKRDATGGRREAKLPLESGTSKLLNGIRSPLGFDKSLADGMEPPCKCGANAEKPVDFMKKDKEVLKGRNKRHMKRRHFDFYISPWSAKSNN